MWFATAFPVRVCSSKAISSILTSRSFLTAGTAISSRMYIVGRVPRKAERLIEVTYEAMMRGIAVIKPGAKVGDIGHAIQKFAESERCSVVRDFCGHGLGLVFHDKPNILHYGTQGEGVTLEPGMLFTVEPMINLGKPHVKMLSDGWTAGDVRTARCRRSSSIRSVSPRRALRFSPTAPRGCTSRLIPARSKTFPILAKLLILSVGNAVYKSSSFVMLRWRFPCRTASKRALYSN